MSLTDRMFRSRFFPRKLSFTREGKVVVLVSLGLGFAAVNTGNNLLYLLFGVSLALIVISGLLSEANLRGVECGDLGAVRPTAGRPATATVSVLSRRKKWPAFSLEAWPLVDGCTPEPARFLDLRAGENAEGACRMTFPHRGEFPIRGMVVSTSFPFSFFRKSVVRETPGAMIVHPRVRPLRADEVPASAEGDEEDRPVAGRGQEFFGVRDYRPGDPPRTVLYRQSAGRPVPVVREFEQSGLRAAWVALVNVDEGREGGADRVEHAVERAASLAVHLVQTGRRVGLATASGIVDPGTGEAQSRRILDFLASVPVLEMNAPGTDATVRAALEHAQPAHVFWVRP